MDKDCDMPRLKPGKREEQPESYRPVALVPCPGKPMKRMVHKRVYWLLENGKRLQSGFQGTGGQ